MYKELAPQGSRRMGMNPNTNGGLLLKDLLLPDVQDFALPVKSHGDNGPGDTRSVGAFLKEVINLNSKQQ